MRRFSQRNALVTLNEINITPLLDLAFVLLIIFVIISPGIRSRQEQGMELNLPKGGAPETRKIEQKNVRVLSVSSAGKYQLGNQWLDFSQIERTLTAERKANPDLIVQLRGDADAPYKYIAAVMTFCQKNQILMDPRFKP